MTITYKKAGNYLNSENFSVIRNDGAQIPFDPANTDYQTFKADLAKGVSLEDANGTAMTADQITTFLATLP